ncbi:hypothetical protein Tco_1569930, partial [Tanacetum coccineum]
MTLFKIPILTDAVITAIHRRLPHGYVLAPAISNYQQQSGYSSHANTDYLNFANDSCFLRRFCLDLLFGGEFKKRVPKLTLSDDVDLTIGTADVTSAPAISTSVCQCSVAAVTLTLAMFELLILLLFRSKTR